MSCYQALAGAYDALTEDVAYARRADFLQRLLAGSRIPVRVILDLACGTGSMTCELTRRGYELIGVDASAEMLAQAMDKAAGLPGVRPIFLQQKMQKLDLYGTVDAAVCCLDSFNYLTRPEDLRETLRRLHLFIAPGGLLLFDINSPCKLRRLDGQVFLDETEDTYCVWRTEYRERSRICTYWVDLFCQQEDGAWQRSLEQHRERLYEPEELEQYLKEAGFTRIRRYGDCRLRRPRAEEQRIYFSCVRE